MHVVAYDPFVSAERYRELGVEKAESPAERLRAGRLHHDPPAGHARDARLPRTPRRSRRCKRRRARHQLRARRAGRRRGAQGRARLRQGRAAPRSTSSRRSRSPTTRCSTATTTSSSRRTSAPRPTEAQDRAGVQTAEQVVAALTGGVVTTAVNIPAISPEDMEVLGPFVPLCRAARPPRRRARGGLLDRPRRGRVPRPHRRARHAPAVGRGAAWACSPATPRRRSTPSTRPALAEERGIDVVRDASARPRATSPTSCA